MKALGLCLLLAVYALAGHETIADDSIKLQIAQEEVLRQSGLLSLQNLKVFYYDINGGTGDEIRKKLNQLGPKDWRGISRDAHLKWTIGWKWPYDQSGKALFQKTTSNIRFELTFPRITKGPMPNGWLEFLALLAKHEYQHAQHALDHYQQIADKIRKAASNTKKFNYKAANLIGEEVLEQIRRLDREYDIATDHGKTEGISFP
jgi:predicted secreted Zn-dependent protease